VISNCSVADSVVYSWGSVSGLSHCRRVIQKLLTYPPEVLVRRIMFDDPYAVIEKRLDSGIENSVL